MSSSSPRCARRTANKLSHFVQSKLIKFDYCSFTSNADDIYMQFEGPYSDFKIVMSHIFTIPFVKAGDRLVRCQDWFRPLGVGSWGDVLLGMKLSYFDAYSHENNFYLEFNHDRAILTNSNLVTIYRGNTPLKKK